MTEDQVRAELRAAVAAAGSAKAWCEAHGISQGLLSNVLAGRRTMTQPFLDALSIERVVTFRYRP